MQLEFDHAGNAILIGETNLNYVPKMSFSKGKKKYFHMAAKEDWSYVWVQIELDRKTGKYLYESVLPSCLFVILSWVKNVQLKSLKETKFVYNLFLPIS